MTRKTFGTILGTLLCLASPALANTIDITSTAPATLTLSPSTDTITLNAGKATLSGPGTVLFQTGSITLGDSEISDQVIPFFFYDTLTINGISKKLTISGQDNVTTTADLISIFQGSPVNFGSYIFTLNGSSYSGTTIGENIPLNLSANVTSAPVPEPATLPLLATGVMSGAVLMTRMRHSTFQA